MFTMARADLAILVEQLEHRARTESILSVLTPKEEYL